MALSSCKWFYACFLFILPANLWSHSGQKHPFYLSVTEIDLNAKTKTLEVSCKIFTNDFETSLEKFSHTKIDLSDPKTKTLTDKYIADYVSKHLQLAIDGVSSVLEFVGSEKEEEGTWSYFQIENVSSIKKLTVKNDLLYDSFESQINIIHVTVGGNRQSLKLSNPDATATFTF
jgi:hypothetical protein